MRSCILASSRPVCTARTVHNHLLSRIYFHLQVVFVKSSWLHGSKGRARACWWPPWCLRCLLCAYEHITSRLFYLAPVRLVVIWTPVASPIEKYPAFAAWLNVYNHHDNAWMRTLWTTWDIHPRTTRGLWPGATTISHSSSSGNRRSKLCRWAISVRCWAAKNSNYKNILCY